MAAMRMDGGLSRTTGIAPAGMGSVVSPVFFQYDWMGRRIAKTVAHGVGNAIYHADVDRQDFVKILAEADLESRLKSDPGKLALVARLRNGNPEERPCPAP